MVPTHQLAGWFKKMEVSATAIAAGLKICLLRTAKMNFEAIAKTEAAIAKVKYPASVGEIGGEIMSAKISAVMYRDSTLAGALNAHANTAFAIQHTPTMRSVENSKASGL